MDGINYEKVVYLGRRDKTTYLFRQATGSIIEFEEDTLYGCSVLRVGRPFNIKQMRTNCYVIS